MAQLIPDTLDFGAYMRQTDAGAKVRPAAAFADSLSERMRPVEPGKRQAGMFSTKLRDRIEFRRGEVTAWAGYNGHRKSMFTGQVALDLCVQRERVLMMSMEMYPADTLARMCRQAFGLGTVAQPSIDHFLAWTDSRLWLFDHVGRIAPDQAMAVIRYFAEECKGSQVFIDSMMMVCKSEEHLDEQKQFLTDTVRSAQEYGVHVHLIAHCRKPKDGDESPPGKYDLRGSAAITDQCHNVITVWANKAKKAKLEHNPHDSAARAEPDARVSVEKQRNGAWEGACKLWVHDASQRFTDESASSVEPYVLRV
jgi:twinkle protein